MAEAKKAAPKAVEAKKAVVTEGNIAFDSHGRKRVGGEDIDLTVDQAKVLKGVGIVE